MILYRHELTSRSSIKKKKVYEFPNLEKEVVLCKRRKVIPIFEKPMLVNKGMNVYGLYMDKGVVTLIMYHSFDSFVEMTDKEINALKKPRKKRKKP